MTQTVIFAVRLGKPPYTWFARVNPHHAAGTSKFRVVFDGSPSPNDVQLNGERLQRDLTFIIARFRLGKIALCADIAKMYRQIFVPQHQRDFQRIL